MAETSKQSGRVLVILPAYNEAGKIGRVVEKVRSIGAADEIVVADDCSTDSTAAESRDAGATVITHAHNMGVGAGIRTGIQYGRKNGFTIGVVMSGDDQHEPKELPLVLARIRENPAHFVQGSRRLKGGAAVNAPLFREVTTRIYSLVFTILAGQRITDGTNGFRAFYLSIFDDPFINLDQEWLNTYELEPYLLYKAIRSPKITVVEVPITVYYRGTSKTYTKMKPFRDWWRIARPLLYLRFGLRR